MNTLRRLLLPRDDGGACYLDHDGNAVVSADQVAVALGGVETLVDRLVRRLAIATGRPEGEIRLSEGLGAGPTPEVAGGGSGAPRPVSGGLRGEITAVSPGRKP